MSVTHLGWAKAILVDNSPAQQHLSKQEPPTSPLARIWDQLLKGVHFRRNTPRFSGAMRSNFWLTHATHTTENKFYAPTTQRRFRNQWVREDSACSKKLAMRKCMRGGVSTKKMFTEHCEDWLLFARSQITLCSCRCNILTIWNFSFTWSTCCLTRWEK